MKKIFTLLFVLTSAIVIAQDAKFEITPTAGYTFSSRTSWYNADMDVVDNYSVGLALNIRVHESMLVEIMYHNVNTDVNTTVYSNPYNRAYYSTPYSMEYYHIGGIREIGGDKVRPFTSFTLGLTRFHPTALTEYRTQDGESGSLPNEDVWALSPALGAGARIMLTNRIGLRLQGRLFLPLYFNGVGVYCGSGCGGGASFGVYTLQLDLSGGLIIGLGEY